MIENKYKNGCRAFLNARAGQTIRQLYRTVFGEEAAKGAKRQHLVEEILRKESSLGKLLTRRALKSNHYKRWLGQQVSGEPSGGDFEYDGQLGIKALFLMYLDGESAQFTVQIRRLFYKLGAFR